MDELNWRSLLDEGEAASEIKNKSSFPDLDP